MKLLIPPLEPPRTKQPQKCQNCLWGRWDGMKQFCSKINCIKEK